MRSVFRVVSSEVPEDEGRSSSGDSGGQAVHLLSVYIHLLSVYVMLQMSKNLADLMGELRELKKEVKYLQETNNSLTERLMAMEGDWSQAARKNMSPTVSNESVAQPNQSQQSISVQHCDVHPGGVHPEVNCRGPSTQYNLEDHDQRQRRPEVNHHA